MARGTQLLDLIARVREETGRAKDVSVGPEDIDAIRTRINRHYTTLYLKYDWPHLRTIFPRITLNAGQRYYDLPDALNVERIEKVRFWYNGAPKPVTRGIDIEDYELYDSDADERNDPVLKWDFLYVEAQQSEQIEIWPIPATNTQQMQFVGIRSISRLVNDADTAQLDDDLIVKFTVAEMLAKVKPEEAKILLSEANDHFRYLKSRNAGDKPCRLGLGDDAERIQRNRSTVIIAGA